jgi:hypothetical protein
MPARLALALQADGWWLRSVMPWIKRSAMPDSAEDRPSSALEHVIMLTKSGRYCFDMEAVKPQSVCNVKRGPAVHPCQDTNGNIGLSRRDIEPSRNFRNTDLIYESLKQPHGLITAGDDLLALDVNPEALKIAHFAAYPKKLVEPLIKAGSPTKCCPVCGKGWARVVEKDYTEDKSSTNHIAGGDSTIGQGWEGYQRRATVTTKTLGFRPACACNSPDTVPARVIDIFGGAGTTAIVAEALGRDSTLIELNPEYVTMARRRIVEAMPGATDELPADDRPVQRGLF